MSARFSALLVPLPETERVLAGHRLRHDPGARSGVPAHVTINSPFVLPEAFDGSVRARLMQILARYDPFSVTFRRTGRFPRTLYLAPEPPEQFHRLIAAVHAAFAEHPPYGGAFDEIVPHLTVGNEIDPPVAEELEGAVEPGLPLTAVAREAWLMATEDDGSWRTHAVLPFGIDATDATDARAEDGSPVDAYRRLPDFGEARLVHRSIAEGAAILELGCGTGRMTHRLLGYGHPVTAVDSSAVMLAHVRGAEVVHSHIGELDLDRRFDCVLLASNLVNVADPDERGRMLSACARHVASDGVVILQRYDPEWAAAPMPSRRVVGGMAMGIEEVHRDGPILHGVALYEADGHTWRHGPFRSRILDDAELADALSEAALRLDGWLDERHSWARIRPT